MSIIIGIDHGYYAIKTAHCSFPAGLTSYGEHEPYTRQGLLEFGGCFFVCGTGRQPIQRDKTVNDNYAELQNARLNEAAEIRKLRTYYDDFKGWAEEFDTAPLEMKRMILSHLIDRVEVGRKYQVIVKFNMKYRQFLECTAETYNTEIGA